VCHGVRIGLRSSSREGLETLRSWLPRAVKRSEQPLVDGLYSLILGGEGPRPGVRRYHVLYRDATQLARTFTLEQVRRAFDRDVSMVIGAQARRRVFVHAGVVGFRNGAVVIPGRSFSGKTTLVRALLAEGGVYYSDEFAVLDPKGRVSPWAEPLSIRRYGSSKPAEPHPARSLGVTEGRMALPVALVVLTSFEQGRRFRPRHLTSAEGTLGLLEHTLPARRRPRAALRALAAAVSSARVLKGARGEAAEAARAIVRLVESARD